MNLVATRISQAVQHFMGLGLCILPALAYIQNDRFPNILNSSSNPEYPFDYHLYHFKFNMV